MVIRCVCRTRKPYRRQPPRYRRLETVPNLYRLPVKPAVETVSNLLYLGGCLLYGFIVRHTQLITIAVYLFRDFRYSIMQGMNKQIPDVYKRQLFDCHLLSFCCCRATSRGLIFPQR